MPGKMQIDGDSDFDRDWCSKSDLYYRDSSDKYGDSSPDLKRVTINKLKETVSKSNNRIKELEEEVASWRSWWEEEERHVSGSQSSSSSSYVNLDASDAGLDGDGGSKLPRPIQKYHMQISSLVNRV